jgi:hypothetical protein
MLRLLPREKHELPMQIVMEVRGSGAIGMTLSVRVESAAADLE